jgi:DNA-binding GntR family transcriptional regulator
MSSETQCRCPHWYAAYTWSMSPRVAQGVESQADIAYREIYNLVLATGAAGTHDSTVWFERALGEQLQLGRTPVREALKRLQNEGLLMPATVHGGLVAASISSAEVESLYQLRESLESLAAELAAKRAAAGEISRSQLAQLADQADVIKKRAAVSDTLGVSDANRSFHQFIATLAANPFLEDALNRLWYRISVSALNNLSDDPDWLEETHAHHDELARLIESGDDVAAASLMHEHIRRAKETYLAHHSAAAAR